MKKCRCGNETFVSGDRSVRCSTTHLHPDQCPSKQHRPLLERGPFRVGGIDLAWQVQDSAGLIVARTEERDEADGIVSALNAAQSPLHKAAEALYEGAEKFLAWLESAEPGMSPPPLTIDVAQSIETAAWKARGELLS